MSEVEPELFIETPDRSTSVFGSADYCGPTGTGMLCEYRYEATTAGTRSTACTPAATPSPGSGLP